MTYKFKFDDGGRSKSAKRQKPRADAAITVLAIARKMSYDTAYAELSGPAKNRWADFDFPAWLSEQPWAERVQLPSSPTTVAEFCGLHPRGTYVCRLSGHVLTVVDGTVHDIIDVLANRHVYWAWRVLPGDALAEKATAERAKALVALTKGLTVRRLVNAVLAVDSIDDLRALQERLLEETGKK